MKRRSIVSILVLVVLVGLFFNQTLFAANLEVGMLTFSFDDGESSLYTQALPALGKYNFPATAYIVTDWIGDGSHVTQKQLRDLYWKGWEIGNHTKSHAELLSLSYAQVKAQIQGTFDALTSWGIKPSRSLAPPYGDFNPTVISQLIVEGVITSSRQAWTEDLSFNDPLSWNAGAINVVSIHSTTTPAAIKDLINQAVSQKKWLVLVIHGVASISTDDYTMERATLNVVATHANTLRSQGKLIVTTVSMGVEKIGYYQKH